MVAAGYPYKRPPSVPVQSARGPANVGGKGIHRTVEDRCTGAVALQDGRRFGIADLVAALCFYPREIYNYLQAVTAV